jgi:phosphatidate cytidylyltransferase
MASPGSGSKSAGKPGELRVRVRSAVVLAALALGAVLAGGFLFAVFSVGMATLVYREWLAMTPVSAFAPRNHVVFAGFLLAMAAIVMLPGWGGAAALLVIAAANHTVLQRVDAACARSVTVATLYCGLPAIALIGLRSGDKGWAAILILFAIVWATDIGAYFVGRRFGGPKLAPSISPGKTQSGAAGGVAAAVAAAGLTAALSGFGNVPAIMAIALVTSIVAQAGDLFESSLKRKAGFKDSGTIIPGHGGMFDRVDGLMPAAVCLFIALQAFQV